MPLTNFFITSKVVLWHATMSRRHDRNKTANQERNLDSISQRQQSRDSCETSVAGLRFHDSYKHISNTTVASKIYIVCVKNRKIRKQAENKTRSLNTLRNRKVLNFLAKVCLPLRYPIFGPYIFLQ